MGTIQITKAKDSKEKKDKKIIPVQTRSRKTRKAGIKLSAHL